jgi:Zn-dependent protease with chaperone function
MTRCIRLSTFTSIFIIALSTSLLWVSASNSEGSSIVIRLVEEKPLVEISGMIFNFTDIVEKLRAHDYELRKAEELTEGSYFISFPVNWSSDGKFLLLYDLTEILPYLAKPVRITIEHPLSLRVTHNLTETRVYENKHLSIAIESIEVDVWIVSLSLVVLFIVPPSCTLVLALWIRKVLERSKLEEYYAASTKINKLMILFNYIPPAIFLVGFLIVFLPTPPFLGLPLIVPVILRIGLAWAILLTLALTLISPFTSLLLIWMKIHSKYLKPVLKEIPSIKKMLKYEKEIKSFSILMNLLPMLLIITIITITILAYDPLSKLLHPLILQQFFIVIGFLMSFVAMSVLIDKLSQRGENPVDERLSRIFSEAVSKAGLKKAPPLIKAKTFYGAIANAGVIGLFRRKIVVTEMAEENLDDEELNMVLLHEIGHIRHTHMPAITVLAAVSAFLLGNSSLVLPDFIKKILRQAFNASDALIVLTIVLVYISLYALWFLTLYFIMKIFERKADAFALKIGMNPEVYIKALVKLSVLNFTPLELPKLQEAFETHPAVIKRLRKTAIKYGIGEDKLKELVDMIIKEFYEKEL